MAKTLEEVINEMSDEQKAVTYILLTGKTIAMDISHSELDDDCLKHYGVLGMKWGKRKVRQDDVSVGRKKAVVSPDNIKSSMKARLDSYEKKKKERNIAAAKKYLEKKEELGLVKKDLEKNGVNSESFAKMYGKSAGKMNDVVFQTLYGLKKQDALNNGISKLDSQMKYQDRAAEARRNGKMTTEQKMAVGAAVVTTAVVAGYALSKYKNISKGKAITADEFMTRFRKSHTVKSSDVYNGILDNKDIVVPKGTKFKRMSANPEYNVRQNVYAAFTKNDVERYKGILPSYFGWISKNNAYQVELEATTKIVSPSLRKRVDTFTDLLAGNDRYKDYYNIPRNATPSQLSEFGKKYYQHFATNEAGKSKIGRDYFDKLSKMGYNAWIDDNDRGRLADIPMVIFNKNNELSRVGATKLTPSEIDEATRIIRELKNRI